MLCLSQQCGLTQEGRANALASHPFAPPPHPCPHLPPPSCSLNRTNYGILLLQALLDDIMAMTRADSEANSSDSSQTQQPDLPIGANAGPPSNEAQAVPMSLANPSLGAEVSTAQHEVSTAQHELLQDNTGAHHQGPQALQAASLSGKDLLCCSAVHICSLFVPKVMSSLVCHESPHRLFVCVSILLSVC